MPGPRHTIRIYTLAFSLLAVLFLVAVTALNARFRHAADDAMAALDRFGAQLATLDHALAGLDADAPGARAALSRLADAPRPVPPPGPWPAADPDAGPAAGAARARVDHGLAALAALLRFDATDGALARHGADLRVRIARAQSAQARVLAGLHGRKAMFDSIILRLALALVGGNLFCLAGPVGRLIGRAGAAPDPGARHDTGLPDAAAFAAALQRLPADRTWLVLHLAICPAAPGLTAADAAGGRLRDLADLMRTAAPGAPAVGYLGGGRFGLVLDPDTGPAAEALVAELQARAAALTDGGEAALRLCAGTALHRPGRSGALALANVAIALEQAIRGGDAVVAYAPALKRASLDARRMRDELERAFERDEFVAFFQPQIAIATGRVTGFEVLARWRHPTRGLLAPAAFLPRLHDAGRTRDLGARMLAQAVDALVAWGRAGHFVGDVGINVTRDELESPAFLDRVKWELDRAGLAPQQLRLEVLETIHVQGDADPVVAALHRLSALGVRIDMDDFGTGSTSITGLRRLGIDRIKIDRAFIRDIDTDPGARELVRSILLLARVLRIEVLAEGVETGEELKALSRLGCALAQGYFIARPMPLADAVAWLDRHDTAGLAQARGYHAGAGRDRGARAAG